MLSGKIAHPLVAFRQKTLLLIMATHLSIYLSIAGFCGLWNFLPTCTCSLSDSTLLVAFLLYLFYFTFIGYGTVLYFFLTTGYLRIKQTYLCRGIHTLHRRQFGRESTFWWTFQCIHWQIGQLYEETSAQNRFWCKYLSVLFLYSVVQIAYFTYTSLFVAGSLPMKLLFGACGVENFAALLAVTWCCSRLIRQNYGMSREWQQIVGKQEKRYPFRLGQQLKFDQLAGNYKNIGKVSFKLLDNYTINSQMFEMVSFFHLFVFFL